MRNPDKLELLIAVDLTFPLNLFSHAFTPIVQDIHSSRLVKLANFLKDSIPLGRAAVGWYPEPRLYVHLIDSAVDEILSCNRRVKRCI